MGMFDNQCMITGIKLDQVVCVFLVERHDGSHSPCTLPIFGRRDPHGSVVDIEAHPSVESLVAGLASAVKVGRLGLRIPDWATHIDVSPDRTGLQNFTELFFRGGHAEYAEARLALTLIERHVWDAVWSAAGRGPSTADMNSVLYPPQLASTFYSEPSRETVELASRFRALQIWLAARDIPWTPLRNGDQFDERDVVNLVATAVERFNAEPAIINGLLDYARWEFDESLTLQELLDGF